LAAGDGGRPLDRTDEKVGRRAAREQVAAYHQACLDELVRYVASAIDGWRTGSLDAHDVDEVLHRYQRAARELWKFCWGTGGSSHLEWIASHIRQMAEDGQVINWWERGAPRPPRDRRLSPARRAPGPSTPIWAATVPSRPPPPRR
jgi:hypothetical protein